MSITDFPLLFKLHYGPEQQLLISSIKKSLAHSPHPSASPGPTSPLAALSQALQMTAVGVYIGCGKGTRASFPLLSGDYKATQPKGHN